MKAPAAPPLREFLVQAGLSATDLEEAVEEARGVVRAAHHAGELLTKAATHVGERSKSEKVKRVATIAGLVGLVVSSKAGVLMGVGRGKK